MIPKTVPRICAWCGRRETRWRMFKIWRGPAHADDLCSFECEAALGAARRDGRVS